MRWLWQRSTARAPDAQLTTDSDTTELPAVGRPDGPSGEGESLREGLAGTGTGRGGQEGTGGSRGRWSLTCQKDSRAWKERRGESHRAGAT